MEKILIPCDFSDQRSALSGLPSISRIIQRGNTFASRIELPIMHDDLLTPLPSFDEKLLKELSDKRK